jgi:hypothetical protein
MQRKMSVLIAACLSLVVVACGQGESQQEVMTSEPMAQVEQDIGTTPYCPSSSTTTGYIEGNTVWSATCGGCTYSGAVGRKGSYYERCCIRDNVNGGVTCGSWKLIKSVCSSCALEP